ncbi:MAG: 1-deoxy-D-xylulose-5-phosphate reductoisomerase [Hyphomicrobiaceae bacterium]|nr:1-deoxy-D-xylulose-5-phosphate reductoisomerase [Hyphomicrobiaceae bacterium]
MRSGTPQLDIEDAPVRAIGEGEPPRRVSVLGATGSVGTSTLDLLAYHSARFEVVALTAQRNAKALAEAARRHRAEHAVIGDPDHYLELKELLAGSGTTVAAGPAGLVEAAERPADCIMAAIVGAAGLEPTFAAAAQGTRVALANKECLVSAGSVFMEAVEQAGGELIPVDSEHSAVLQCLDRGGREAIECVHLTASGGPFRAWERSRLATATPEMATRHPNWSMGAKISVDSATLMNKGLELIEAKHLFGLDPGQLGVVVHPQSVIHCLVSYLDGSVMAHMSTPDMTTPIAVSLAWPRRMSTPTDRLDLVKLSTLTFERPDEQRFPSLRLAREAMERGGSAPAILNAANEIAVEQFLAGKLGFLDIAALVEQTLCEAERLGYLCEVTDLAGVLEVDRSARSLARACGQMA